MPYAEKFSRELTNHFRICSVEFLGVVATVNPDKPFEKPHFVGMMAPALSEYPDYIFSGWPVPFNRTYIDTDEMGTTNPDGTMTGCGGYIQRNESDIAVCFVHYPTAEYEKVYPFQMSEIASPTVMVSTYRVVHDTEVSDVISQAKTMFQVNTYVAIVAMVALITILLILSDFLSSNSKWLDRLKVMWDVFCYYLIQPTNLIDELEWVSPKILLISLLMLSFLVTAVWTNLMSTASVVAKKAEVISTYQELVSKPNIKPLFMAAMSDHESFARASPASVKGKIWARILKNETDTYVIRRFSPEAGARIATMLRSGKVVFLIQQFMAKSIVSTVFRFYYQANDMEEIGDLRAWLAVDPDEQQQMRSFVMASHFRHTIMGKHVIKRARVFTEVGLMHRFMEAVDRGFLTEAPIPVELMEKYISPTVETKEVSTEIKMLFGNFRPILIAYLWALLFSLWIFVLESLSKFASKIRERQNRKKRLAKAQHSWRLIKRVITKPVNK